MHIRFLFLAIPCVLVGAFAADPQADPLALWTSRFAFHEPDANAGGVCVGVVGALPSFTVQPTVPGDNLVRVSLAFSPAAFPVGMGVQAVIENHPIPADVRILTRHPGSPASVRRAFITFPYTFSSPNPVDVKLTLVQPTNDDADPRPEASPDSEQPLVFALGDTEIALTADAIRVKCAEGRAWTATPVAPARSVTIEGTTEIIEWSRSYKWVRILVPDPDWPRIVEVRVDALGSVIIQLHLQRRIEGDATAPDIGWRVTGLEPVGPAEHAFAQGEAFALQLAGGARMHFPTAPFQRRGTVRAQQDGSGWGIEYMRCRAEDGVPFQNTAWRSAALVVAPRAASAYNAFLEPDLQYSVPPAAYDAVYHSGADLDLALWPDVHDAQDYAWHAAKNSTLVGDDFGNITVYDTVADGPGSGAMMRINNCVPMFDAAYRRDDIELRNAALLWCLNTYDLGLWWGDETDIGGWQRDYSFFGGTRHPISETTVNDPNFQWRKDPCFDFCTKGFDSFFYAYEETGDPRMSTALYWQLDYATEHIHSDQLPGQTRNVGVAADFLRLYRFTGVDAYREKAIDLFRELRLRLSEGDLFSQGGEPIVADPGFIDDDEHGYAFPFAKPYILGYALEGLPQLLAEFPDEPKLRDVVRAVADFLAASQDPTGGWRYPHPASSLTSYGQNHEASAFIGRAATVLKQRGEDVTHLTDAVERTLQASVLAYRKSGAFMTTLAGWEISTGTITEREQIYDLYTKPADRDPSRDYTEGTISTEIVTPEGAATFDEALQFYLAHRPAERLYNANGRLAQVLERLEDGRIKLVPAGNGPELKLTRADNAEVTVVLRAPVSATFPEVTTSAFDANVIAWNHDPATGAMSFTVDADAGTLVATFVPHHDYVECFQTVWPKEGTLPPDSVTIESSMQLKGGIFAAQDAGISDRILRLANDAWSDSSSAVADAALVACTSADGAWVAGAASEHGTGLFNIGVSSIDTKVSADTRLHIPTTTRNVVFLVKGDKDDIRDKYVDQLDRWSRAAASPPSSVMYRDTYGTRDRMPRWYDARTDEREYPLAWEKSNLPFETWRAQAREAQLRSFHEPPVRVPFEPAVLEEEQREGYVAKKIAININQYCRVPAYLLVPDGEGPFPGIVALHDHGAHFLIGKEKMVRPFNVAPEIAADSLDWITKYYGGRYVGDELAKRGYVVLSIDVTFWGERGRMEGVEYEDQQALAANMFQFGYSWAGYNAWDDIRSAEFLQGLPQVNPDRIGCLGLSMGAYRTWQLCAATDIVKAGAVICWMGDLEGFMVPDQNQTRGQSSFSMIHPGMFRELDYPDVASIACPKPMLFFAGLQDTLFGIASVERCFDTMHKVWTSQHADDRLVCKFFDVPHLFNVEMQDEAFAWIDKYLKP